MTSPTYRDIQNETGFSLSTISRYFNGENLRKQSVERIETAIKSLGYTVPNHVGLVKKEHTKLIGLFFPNLTGSPFYSELCFEMEKALKSAEFSTIVCNYIKQDYNEKDTLNIFLESRVDAIVAIPQDPNSLNLVNIQNRSIPIVLLDKLSNMIKTDAVIVDNELISQMAVNEFAQHNHKKISIITAGNNYTANKRIKGYQKAMNALGLEINDDYILKADISESTAYNDVVKLLSSPNPPTAIFCANHHAMIDCLLAINDMNLSIPEDISIIGIDDKIISSLTKPKLTMILQPITKIAQCVTDIIVDKLNGTQDSKHYLTMELPTTLIKGGSISTL